jgi:hypothetical protein
MLSNLAEPTATKPEIAQCLSKQFFFREMEKGHLFTHTKATDLHCESAPFIWRLLRLYGNISTSAY